MQHLLLILAMAFAAIFPVEILQAASPADYNPVPPPANIKKFNPDDGAFASTKEAPELAIAKKLQTAKSMISNKTISNLAKDAYAQRQKDPTSAASFEANRRYNESFLAMIGQVKPLLTEVVTAGGELGHGKNKDTAMGRKIKNVGTRLHQMKAELGNKKTWNAINILAGGNARKISAAQIKQLQQADENMKAARKQTTAPGNSIESHITQAKILLIDMEIAEIQLQHNIEIDKNNLIFVMLNKYGGEGISIPPVQTAEVFGVTPQDDYNEQGQPTQTISNDDVYGPLF